MSLRVKYNLDKEEVEAARLTYQTPGFPGPLCFLKDVYVTLGCQHCSPRYQPAGLPWCVMERGLISSKQPALD